MGAGESVCAPAGVKTEGDYRGEMAEGHIY